MRGTLYALIIMKRTLIFYLYPINYGVNWVVVKAYYKITLASTFYVHPALFGAGDYVNSPSAV